MLTKPIPLRIMRATTSQRGFSLVELGVWLVLSTLVLFALTVLFANSSRARNEVERSTQLIENGRYALEVLRDDLHLAGYYGGAVPMIGSVGWSGMITNNQLTTPDPCATTVANLGFGNSPLRWPVAVYGYAAGATAPACVQTANPGQKPNTAVLVVHRTSTQPTAAGSLDSNSVYVQASGCPTELAQGPTKLFAIDLGSNSGSFALHRRVANQTTCGGAADIYQYQTRIYYVSNESVPTLRLLTISGSTNSNEPVVEGIEDLRFEYGVDNLGASGNPGGDGTPDTYYVCDSGAPCAYSQWANVTAVRISLLSRSIDASPSQTDTKTYTLAGTDLPAFNDSFKRHAYTAVVRLMNPVGWREQ